MDLEEMTSSSSKYIRAEVSARITGGYEDVSVGVASMAFATPDTEPVTGAYSAATWEPGGPPYHMRKIATGLVDGRYDIWVRVQLGAEDVREKVGVLVVT